MAWGGGGSGRQHCVQEWNSEGSISPSTYLYRFEVSGKTVSVDSNRVNVFGKLLLFGLLLGVS